MTNDELLIAISDIMDKKFKEELAPLKGDVQTLKDDVQSLKGDVQTLKGDVQSLKGDVQTLKGDVQTLKGDVRTMKSKIQTLEVNVQTLNHDMQSVKNEQKRINLIIENEIRPDIKLLIENFLPAARRYEKSADAIESIQLDMDVMKKIIREHTDKLEKIS